MQRSLQNQGTIKWKHAMHLVRLLMAGITVLEEQRVPVRVEDDQADRLHAVRRGELTFDEVESWRRALQEQFEQAIGVERIEAASSMRR